MNPSKPLNKMTNLKIYISAALVALAALSSSVQAEELKPSQFSLKATANIGLGRAMNTRYAIPEIQSKNSASDFGLDFGWTCWRYNKNSLEANIGLTYGNTSVSASLDELNYHYSAPAIADMDQVPYVRYYQLHNLDQKLTLSHFYVPIYVTYRYHFSERFNVHALLGLKIGFNLINHTSRSSGSLFAYGVYPEYDDLLIDAPYMNEFGESEINKSNTTSACPNLATASILAGIGAGVRIYGPLSAEASLRYEAGLSNVIERIKPDLTDFNDRNAPVTYTVPSGQQTKSLTRFLTSSKPSRLTLALSLIYHF